MSWAHVFTNFNGSVWHGVLISASLCVVIYVLAFLSLKDGFYFFDPKHNPGMEDSGEFGPHFQRYADLAKLLVTLSVGAMAFLFNSVATIKTSSQFDVRMVKVAPVIVGLFGSATAYLIAFMFCETWFYEIYCHTAKHDSYKRWKYALCITFATAGAMTFILGFLWLAVNTLSPA
jgi:hypothetical protein